MKKLKTIALIWIAIAIVIALVNYELLTDSERSVDATIQTVAFPQQANAEQRAVDRESVQENTAQETGPTYVGRKVCSECHQENFDQHLKHGHASTFFKTEETELPDVFDGKEYEAGEDYGTYSYKKDDAGKLIASIKTDASTSPFPLQYILGSGHNAVTFLTLSTDSDGQTVGMEHRASCYRDERIDLTVGHEKYKPETDREKYGTVVRGVPLERCVYCHTTTFKFEQGQVTDLMSHVDCEKCHGPGSEHVAMARKDDSPPPFSVGMTSWDAESEIQLCGDCHRLPKAITQQELRNYPDLLVRFQPIGMLRSKCYLESDQAMRCTTCHNPHESVHHSGRKIDHVSNCIGCHDQDESAHVICPVNAETGCIECHMPEVEQGQGIKFHDHWIRVRDQ